MAFLNDGGRYVGKERGLQLFSTQKEPQGENLILMCNIIVIIINVIIIKHFETSPYIL